ncbi:MAG: pyridoxal-dependent decarboxylase, pyridoxal binding domain protein [Acaryochloridaceae cyanobacterium SU_2_1]|nr:pyridoxal-dependent decarboxylase, pyridoxal binding domain protein [Acaryochloridaceae cyanobacterium SU_2_1]
MINQITKSHQANLETEFQSSPPKSYWFQQLDLAEIARQYSTPLYITNRAQILSNLQAFKNILGENKYIYFPVKVNPCLATFKILAEQGCGADCASSREIQLARLAGIPTSQLSYYSPAPDLSLAVTLLQDGGNVIIDSISKVTALEAQLGNIPFSGKLFLRVNPPLYNSYGAKADYQKHTSHGSLTSQFGLPTEEVLPFLNATKLPFSGLHVHVGTQMDNVEVFQESLDVLHELCDTIHALTHHIITDLNLGGGLGIPTQEEDQFPSITELGDALKSKFRPEFTYKMEPGNALFGNATALLTRVVTRKSTRGKGWAIVDVGSDQLLKVTLAGFAQEIFRADGTVLPKSGLDSVAGPLCFAGDVLLPETDLRGVKEGDLLLLPNNGAYCRSIGNHFNGYSEPATLIVDDSQEIGLAYTSEDPYWEPTIQSFQPYYREESDLFPKTFSDQQVENIRSVYLNKQCGKDTYSFHDFTRVAKGHYEMSIEVDSPVAFISLPTVIRIISDAAVAVTIDNLGLAEKNISVWGSRSTVSLNSILRSKRRHRLSLYLTPMMNSSNSKKQRAYRLTGN